MFLIHGLCLLAVFTGVTWKALALCFVLYFGRMWFITAGYHRYFSHRSYKTSRAFQFVLAFGGGSAAQKGALWWASHHRDHHRFSDTDRDVHSPLKGFWWSHIGWILCDKYKGWDPDSIKDFNKFPELRFITKHDWIPPWTVAIASYLIAGWPGLIVGFFWSTVLLWHGTFTVNSLAHVMGRRRYATTDTSRNSALIALWTGGEGWHNNHHYYQAAARNGFFWWEYDPTYYVLKVLSWFRIVRDLKVPPARVLKGARVREGSFDVGMFKAHWGKASAALLAHTRWADRDRAEDGSTVDAAAELAAVRAALDAADGDADPVPSDAALLAVDAAEAESPTVRENLTDQMHASRAALEESVRNAMRAAEDLAQLSRRQRSLSRAD
ncbi:MAG: acyl-CoA desaturase [Acidimicrobiales bacterium]|nr:acyl-CoA desaturase [Acidimicrobiales bacterium]